MDTNNNGLMATADLLEEIYTDPNFPKGTTALPQSLKDSGKSRADLWAFAATIALEFGIDNNNRACDGNPRGKCGILAAGEDDCKMEWKRPVKFQTGRKDCIADPNLARPWCTAK